MLNQEFIGQFVAANSWHDEIGKKQVHALRVSAVSLQRLSCASSDHHPVSRGLEGFAGCLAFDCFILGQKNGLLPAALPNIDRCGADYRFDGNGSRDVRRILSSPLVAWSLDLITAIQVFPL